MEKTHYIHSRGGRIGTNVDTGPADVDLIVARLKADPRGHLILHFHGGLVDKASGLAIVDTLTPVYSPSPAEGGYPVFFVWESGAWEAIRNNLLELRDEPVFKNLVRKALQYSLEHLGGVGSDDARSLPAASYGTYETAALGQIERYWADPSPINVPFDGVIVNASQSAARSAETEVSEEAIEEDLESDIILRNALATLPSDTARGADVAGVEQRRSLFSDMAADVLSDTPPGTVGDGRGIITLAKVAFYLAKVVRGVLRRYNKGRDHGLYATCVEEAVRAFTVLGSAGNEWAKAIEWNRMKKDTADAFGPDPDVFAGTALLERLMKAVDGGYDLKKVTLVGHSTGAIYIAHWLEHSAGVLPDSLTQDVVLLAPAITYDLFANTLVKHADRIGRFRLFAMQDELERQDQVWGSDESLETKRDWRRFIYPSSLLYLVSGILESTAREDGTLVDEPDMPLVGMQRFFRDESTYPGKEFTAIKQIRDWVAGDPRTLVWSKTTVLLDGGNCGSIDHGAFDNDPATLESLSHIVAKGF